MKIVVIFHRLGPYHVARLKAAGKLCRLHVIEFSSVDDTYLWDVVDEQTGFARTTLFTDSDVANKSSFEIRAALNKALLTIVPDVIAIPGWSGRPAFLALALCRRVAIPAIAMSDSTEFDQARCWWREWIKKRVVGNFSAALVGGKPHADYIYKLGMPRDRIFSGYDVVDNDYFFESTAKVLKDERAMREYYNLPENYFLGSNRFISKKNLSRLILAYAKYRVAFVGSGVWKLVILGDGELRPQLESLISNLGLADDVILPGFKQYSDLPVYYGLARAFVHASTTEQWGLVVNEAMASGLPVLVSERCGCAADLVQHGKNGFTFDPYEVEELTKLMIKLGTDECDLAAMGEISRQIINSWTPKTFAEGLASTAKLASVSPPVRYKWMDKVLLSALGLG